MIKIIIDFTEEEKERIKKCKGITIKEVKERAIRYLEHEGYDYIEEQIDGQEYINEREEEKKGGIK